MASLNKVLLMGNLTRNPELRYTPGSNAAVCEFGIAINRRYVQNGAEKDETCFVDIVVWGKQAESCSRFLQKGSAVFIEGRLVFDQWTEKDTQKKRSRLRVTAERVQFLNMNSRRDDMDNGGMDESMPGDDGMSQTYASPRQAYSGGGVSQARSPYQRQQYNEPPSYGNGGNRSRQGTGSGTQGSGSTAHPNESAPAMPEEDPFEDVDDIPF